MHYGEWEARPGKDLMESHPELMRSFFRCEVGAPGGECAADVRRRVTAVFHEIVAAHRGRTVALVSHGNAIMALLAELLGVPEAATWSFALDNASLTRLHVGDGGRVNLRTMNDHSHTEGLTA
jgi:broad specificity phosphatase PhoE